MSCNFEMVTFNKSFRGVDKLALRHHFLHCHLGLVVVPVAAHQHMAYDGHAVVVDGLVNVALWIRQAYVVLAGWHAEAEGGVAHFDNACLQQHVD